MIGWMSMPKKSASIHAGREVKIRRGPLPFSERSRLSAMRRSWTCSSQVIYDFPLAACLSIKRTPDASLYVSGKEKKSGSSSLLNDGWDKVFVLLYGAQIGCVRKNVNALVNYTFANFWKPNGYFLSHLCRRHLFQEKKVADLETGHFSLHGYVHLSSLGYVFKELTLRGLLLQVWKKYPYCLGDS